MIYLIVLVFLFFYIGFRGNTVLTTLYAINLNANSMEVGIIIGLAAFFPMFFAIFAGRVSDRIGKRLPLLFGSFGVSAALMLPFLFRDKLYILYLSQALFGLAFIFLLVNVQNLVGGISTPQNRSQNYAIYSLGVSTAGLLGPSIAGFSIDHLGYAVTYLMFAIMAAVPGLFIAFNIFRPPDPKPQEVEANSIKDLLNSSALRRTYITSGIILIGVGIYEFYFPIYGSHIGFSASLIGVIISINASAYFIVRLLMPALTKKFGEELVFAGCLLISGSAFFFIPLFDSFTALAVVSFIVGIGLGCGQPLSLLMTYNASPEGRTGEVLGIRLTVNKFIQFSVPVIFGSVGTLVGFLPVFWSNAVLLFTGGLFFSAKKKKMPKELQGQDD